MRTEACFPCRERKLRCDITKSGSTCSRCIEYGRDEECIVPARQKRKLRRRTGAERKRHRVDDVGSSVVSTMEQQLPTANENSPDTIRVAGEYSELAAVLVSHLQAPQSHVVFDEAINDGQTLNVETLVDTVHVEDARPEADLPSDSEDAILSSVCKQIASPTNKARITAQVPLCAEAMEYQNPLNAAGILGEVLAQDGNSHHRLVQINYRTQTPKTRRELELSGLDEHDIALLTAKGALEIPPRDICEEFLKNFFTFAFPYAPILDRCDLLAQYERQDHSLFVIQALLANAVPSSSKELISRAGFPNHETALKTFYKRAVLLYDFNCEKSQLYLLQGALLLGVQWVSYVNDKDYRYWISTATRIAMRMGLHRRHIQDALEPRFYNLLKRIWCVIWIRDVLMVTTGLDNARRIPPDCDIPDIIVEDWFEDESSVPESLQHCLPPITLTQKQFFIHLAQLALIGSDAFSAVLTIHPSEINHQRATEILGNLKEWRQSLPGELRVDSTTNWQYDGRWTIVLLAWSYRIECHIKRALWQATKQAGIDDFVTRQQLQNVVLDLDVIIRRAVLNDVCSSTTAATNVALSIELLLDPRLSSGERLICEEAVKNAVAFIEEVQDIWTTLRGILRLFSWVVSHKAIHFKSGKDWIDRLATGKDNMEGDSTVPDCLILNEQLEGWPNVVIDDIGENNGSIFNVDPFFDFQDYNNVV